MLRGTGDMSIASKLFIIGSGFTNSATHKAAPLNRELLSSIRQYDKTLWDDLYNRYLTEDVEIGLTRLDMDIITNSGQKELVELRKKAEVGLTNFFRNFRFREDMLLKCCWLKDFVQGTFAEGDIVVSLNYDCLLEGLLDRYRLWTPNGGYGKAFKVYSGLTGAPPSPITVLKIHGSENFHREPVIGSQTDKSLIFTVVESIFPVSGKSKYFCLPDKESTDAIIAPSFVKIFPSNLITLMLEALEDAAIRAETLVLIGCGLRPEDGFLYLLLWRFVQGLLTGTRRIVIIDPNASSLCNRVSITLEYDLSRYMHPIDKFLEDGWPDLTKELGK